MSPDPNAPMDHPSQQHPEGRVADDRVADDRTADDRAADDRAADDRAVVNREKVAFGRGDLWLSVAVAMATLAIYLATLAPGLLQDDSAEMQTLAATLGYAHPTGYPVYLLIAKLATWVPPVLGIDSEIAFRVNLLSALMGAAAAGLVCALGKLLTGRRWIAVAGAMALAVSPTLWSQAIIAEVYTSSVVCMLGVLLALEVWRQTARLRWLFAAGCLGGASLGVHATVGLMAPACLLMLAITPGRRKAHWTAATAGALAGVAITLAAFAVIDRAESPTSYFRTVINPSRSVWDLDAEDLDAKDVHGFFYRVKLSMSAPQFAGLLTSQPPAVTRQKAVDYAINLTREYPWPWLLLAVAGLLWLARRNMPMTLVLAATYLTHLCYDLQFDGVVHVMYIATYVPIALFGIAGLAAACDGCGVLAARMGRRREERRGRREERGEKRETRGSLFPPPSSLFPSRLWPPWAYVRRIGNPSYDLLLGWIGLGIVAWPMLWAGAWKDGRRTFWLPPGERDAFQVKDSAKFHHEVRRLIRDLEPRAVVFTGWCTLYPYYYVAHLEQDRTDLVFIQDYPHRGQKGLADSALKYVEEVSSERPVYFTHRVEKVAEVFELEQVRRGGETLYRLGQRIEPRP